MTNFYEFMQLLEVGPMALPAAPPGGPAGGGLGGPPLPGLGAGGPPPPMGGGMGGGMGGMGMGAPPMGGAPAGGGPNKTKEITKLDVWNVLEKILDGKPASVEKPSRQKGPDQLDSGQPQPSALPSPTGAPPTQGGMAGPQPQQLGPPPM